MGQQRSTLPKCEWASEGESLNGPTGSVWASKGPGCLSGLAEPVWPIKAGVVQWISGNQYGRSGSVESEWASKGQHYPSASGPTESVWASEDLDILSGPARPMWPARAGGLVGPEWTSGARVGQ